MDVLGLLFEKHGLPPFCLCQPLPWHLKKTTHQIQSVCTGLRLSGLGFTVSSGWEESQRKAVFPGMWKSHGMQNSVPLNARGWYTATPVRSPSVCRYQEAGPGPACSYEGPLYRPPRLGLPSHVQWRGVYCPGSVFLTLTPAPSPLWLPGADSSTFPPTQWPSADRPSLLFSSLVSGSWPCHCFPGALPHFREAGGGTSLSQWEKTASWLLHDFDPFWFPVRGSPGLASLDPRMADPAFPSPLPSEYPV